MYIKPSRILPIFLRYGIAIFLFLTIVGITISQDFKTIHDPYSWDEHLYKNVSNNFTVEHIRDLEYNVQEIKPLTFLVLQKSLNDADPFLSRGLNLILIIICTFLIYKITNNKFTCLFILIPIFLDSMWLTAEIIEVTFVLLSIQYANKSGIFIGLSTIFRPSGILYTLLLKKKQMIYVLIIGTIYALILVYLGLFNSYLFAVINYGANDGFFGIEMMVIIILGMFFIIGLNKRIIGYIIASVLFLSVKMYPHYFLPIMTFLFVGFLLNMNEDFKEIQ